MCVVRRGSKAEVKYLKPFPLHAQHCDEATRGATGLYLYLAFWQRTMLTNWPCYSILGIYIHISFWYFDPKLKLPPAEPSCFERIPHLRLQFSLTPFPVHIYLFITIQTRWSTAVCPVYRCSCIYLLVYIYIKIMHAYRESKFMHEHKRAFLWKSLYECLHLISMH